MTHGCQSLAPNGSRSSSSSAEMTNRNLADQRCNWSGLTCSTDVSVEYRVLKLDGKGRGAFAPMARLLREPLSRTFVGGLFVAEPDPPGWR